MTRVRWQALDAVAALAVLLVCANAALEAGRPTWWQWMLLAAVAVPIAARDRWPLSAAAVTLGASLAVTALTVIPVFASPVLCAAVGLTQYQVGVKLDRSRSLPALAVAIAAALALAARWPAAPLVSVPAVTVGWLAGWLVRHRRRAADRSAADRAGQAVSEERLRIARDMHDAVAHNLSMIAMKASVAQHVAVTRPEEVPSALAIIETASREALAEIRRAVGLLRAGDDPLIPSGSEDDLRALGRRLEEAGVQVELTLTGETVPPAGIRLVVYRILQEAVTNVVRHAGADRCAVTVRTGADAVTVQVIDDGSAAAPAGTGHGLLGMRERIAACGGTLEAGPAPRGGFSVHAHIPYGTPGREGQP